MRGMGDGSTRLVPVMEAPQTSSDVDPATPAGTPRSFFVLLALRGVWGVLFGLAAAFWPREHFGASTQLFLPVDTVDLLLMGYLVVLAVLLVLQSRTVPQPSRTAMLGQAIVTLPAIVFLWLGDDAGQLRAAVCIWALLHGLLELWIYLVRRHDGPASDFLVFAGLHVLLAVVVGFGDTMGALTVLGFTGGATLIAGVFAILGGLSRNSSPAARSSRSSASSASSSSSSEDPDEDA